MSDSCEDVVALNVDTWQVAYVKAKHNSNAESYEPSGRWPSWIEVRSADREPRRIGELSDLPTIISHNFLEKSVVANPSEWALIISCELPDQWVIRERRIPGYTHTAGISHHDFCPWIVGKLLYFIAIDRYEGILKPGNAGIWIYQLDCHSFELRGHRVASAAELESGEKQWMYTRDQLTSRFSNAPDVTNSNISNT